MGFELVALWTTRLGRLKKLSASAIKKHQFGVAVSLDTQNAFNSMPWTCIMDALNNAKACQLHAQFQNLGVLSQTFRIALIQTILRNFTNYGSGVGETFKTFQKM